MSGQAVFRKEKGVVKVCDIIRRSAADEVFIDILVFAFFKVGELFRADDSGIVLISGNIGGNRQIEIVLYFSKLNHAGNCIGNRIGIQNFKGI